MSDFLSELLIYPFEKAVLPYPDGDAPVLLWGARHFIGCDQLGTFECVQSFKPYADEWSAHNTKVLLSLPEKNEYSAIFCVLPKQKEESLYRLASSLSILSENGLLLSVAANDAGGKRLEKWYVELGLQPTSLSKSKCRIVWAKKDNIDEEKILKFMKAGSQQSIQVEGLDFITKPGIFGWNKIDRGSKLLVQSLPNNLKGNGADFGCGYGYLSNFILDGNVQVKKMYIFDADDSALQCTKENLKQYEKNVEINYRWQDLTLPVNNIKPLDWIVMNPPFHKSKEMSVDVGIKFVETAARLLRKGGRLYMVANAHLPYERILENNFSENEKIVEEQGFKVFLATK